MRSPGANAAKCANYKARKRDEELFEAKISGRHGDTILELKQRIIELERANVRLIVALWMRGGASA